MTLDLEAMKVAARECPDMLVGHIVVDMPLLEKLRTFHQAASPSAVLALIERLEDEHAANAMLIEENDRLQKALEAARAQIPEPSPLHHRRILFTESADYDCWKCYRALVAEGIMSAQRMILCPVCGNKRCPKASDHDLPCTGSNEPGQPGSVY